MPASCARCSVPMNVGEMAVFALRSGPDFCWHVQCFVCCEDGELLVDHVYCWDAEKEKLYCSRHWSESLKPRCAGCEEVGVHSSILVFQCISMSVNFVTKIIQPGLIFS